MNGGSKMANVDTADEKVMAYLAAAEQKKHNGESLTNAEREVLQSMSDDPDCKVQITWYTITLWERLA